MKLGGLLEEQVWGCIKSFVWNMVRLRCQHRCPSGDAKKAGGFARLEFGREVWSGNVHLGIFHALVVFKAIRLEIAKAMCS